MTAPIWLTEADVVSLVSLADAIPALERMLVMEARGEAENMTKTQLGFGAHGTLHALGAAVPGAGLVGAKSWAHTGGGAAPLLMLWDSETGALRAVVEAFALGQMRTGAITGVATKWLAAKGADEMAIVGSGKQAVTQVAAVHAAMKLKRLRVYSPTPANRQAFAARMRQEFGFEVQVADSVEACVKNAPIVTAATLATKPFLTAAMLARGTHVNAIGAIVPARIEFTGDIFPRCAVVAVDNLPTVQKLSQEFINYYGANMAPWDRVTPLCQVIAAGQGRPAGADLTLFKAMGMGLSDLAVGAEILSRAAKRGLGYPPPARERAQPRLQAEGLQAAE